jgi:hypothetical protein
MDALPADRLRAPSVWSTVLLGWIFPGLGHAAAGRPARGLYFATIVLATYLGGLWLTDFRAVSWDREPVWFYAQALAGAPTAVAAWWTRDLEIVRRVPTFDVGILYTAVAALLNAIVVADALAIVDEGRRAARARDAERRDAEVLAMAELAERLAPPAGLGAEGAAGDALPAPAPETAELPFGEPEAPAPAPDAAAEPAPRPSASEPEVRP